MSNARFKLLLTAYIVVAIGLFLYSFTQIDLNLTLSTVSLWQTMQRQFMHIGYFNRPLSTGIYIILVACLFMLYLYSLLQAYKKMFDMRQIGIIIGVICALLFFSYPAFSHDIFNYMFDAKTVGRYGVNPYRVKPLDFLHDPWLNFMRWTHRSSIYPPLWIGITVPLYLLGFNKLIPIILNFKAIILISYLSIVFVIGHSMENINSRYKEIAVVFFALNPLVLIEGLISAHNDMFMLALAVLAFYFLQKQRKVVGLLMLSLSVAIKWVTVLLLPLLIIGPRRFFSFLFMLLGLIIVVNKVEIQPWYFLWILPFSALNIDRIWIALSSIGFSFGLLLRYAPFLYLGNWDPPVPEYKFWLTIVPLVISLLIVFYLQYVYNKASTE